MSLRQYFRSTLNSLDQPVEMSKPPYTEETAQLQRAVAEARIDGWAVALLRLAANSPQTFLALCEPLGQTFPSRRGGAHVDVLRPREPADAPSRSLSFAHGTDSFPPHVDGAHLPTPPRFVVLYCAIDTESRPTLLFRWANVGAALREGCAAHREVFVFGSGRQSFYDTISSAGRPFVRYDSDCMLPATRRAGLLLGNIRAYLNSHPGVAIEWAPGVALVIDNWKVLHARAPCAKGGTRELFRVLLADDSLQVG
jgi:alpha-ketoglutarate-dependent taurine dioxygenase